MLLERSFGFTILSLCVGEIDPDMQWGGGWVASKPSLGILKRILSRMSLILTTIPSLQALNLVTILAELSQMHKSIIFLLYSMYSVGAVHRKLDNLQRVKNTFSSNKVGSTK